MQKIAFRAMNCQMMAAVDGEGQRIARRLEQVPGWFAAWESRLSRFLPDSELSRINQHAGGEIQVSSLMEDVLKAASRAARESDGLVTPTLLCVLELNGYDRSFEAIQAASETQVVNGQPLRLENEAPTTDCSIAEPVSEPGFQIGAHTRILKRTPGVRLDLGGIVKGWAADRAAQRLRKLGPALVDAGGDIAVSGPKTDGNAWPVGVIDPFQPGKHIDLLLLERGGVATSGRDRRRWIKDKLWQHHIIDPRDNQPAQTDVLTATVVAPNARTAEMAAKVALILGSWRAIQWLDQRPALAGLLVLEDGEILHSRRWMNYIWR
jgi:thiamine biosynthesis lipoprotein